MTNPSKKDPFKDDRIHRDAVRLLRLKCPYCRHHVLDHVCVITKLKVEPSDIYRCNQKSCKCSFRWAVMQKLVMGKKVT